MQLTFATDLGQSYTIEVDGSMEFENIQALLEAEVRTAVRIRITAQLIDRQWS